MIEDPGKSVLNPLLWLAQIALATGFVLVGWIDLFDPLPLVDERGLMPTGSFGDPFVRLLGVTEIGAAIGLVVPALTGIRPERTVYAARLLLGLMGLFLVVHMVDGALVYVLFDVIPCALLVFVAWGRQHVAPFVDSSPNP